MGLRQKLIDAKVNAIQESWIKNLLRCRYK